MGLKAIVDSLDAVPEALREHYEQTSEGDYRLSVEPSNGWQLDNVDGLKSALSKARNEAREAKQRAEAFADLDPEQARDAMERLQKLADENPEGKAAEQIEAIKRQMQEKLAKREEELTGVANRYRTQLEKELVDSKAASALAKHKGSVDLLLPHVQRMVRVMEEGDAFVTRVVDDTGETRLTKKASSTAPMDIEELVESMKQDERFAAGFAGTGATGGGATPSRAGGKATGRDLSSLVGNPSALLDAAFQGGGSN